MSKSISNTRQNTVIKKASFLEPINKNDSEINSDELKLNPVDPNFLTKLSQSLPSNKEIRVKRIYHVNKPFQAPPENPIEKELEDENIDSTSDDEIASESSSNDSRLSYISNPASVIRTNTKINHSQKIKKHFKTLPNHYCVHCDIENQRAFFPSYNMSNLIQFQTPNYFSNSCPICYSNYLNYIPNPQTHLIPIISNTTDKNNSYFHSSFLNSKTKLAPGKIQKMFPPIDEFKNSTKQSTTKFPKPDSNSYYKQYLNTYIIKNNRNGKINRTNNISSMSYTDLYHHKNKLLDYTYDKFSPQNNGRSISSFNRLV